MSEFSEERVGLAIETALRMLGGKWKGRVLYLLQHGIVRFNQLRRHLPGITQRMLTLQLRELEQDGLIERLPLPHIGYRLTEASRDLVPLLALLRQWGDSQRQRLDAACANRAAD